MPEIRQPEVESAGASPGTSTASEELLHKFQAGDQEAFDRLWARYLPRLKRWAHARLPPASRGDTNTDDLVQQAFVRSLAPLRKLETRGTRSLFAYFKTVILNLVRDYARQSKRRPQLEALESDVHANRDPSPLEQLLGQDLLERYESALAGLAPDDQEIIRAFVELRCTDRELAELFEKPSADAARMARGRALARLAHRMGAPANDGGSVRSAASRRCC